MLFQNVIQKAQTREEDQMKWKSIKANLEEITSKRLNSLNVKAKQINKNKRRMK